MEGSINAIEMCRETLDNILMHSYWFYSEVILTKGQHTGNTRDC